MKCRIINAIITDMDATEKQKAIHAIHKEQLVYINKTLKMSKLPTPKRASTEFKRAIRYLGYATKVLQLEIQKRLIISKPIEIEFTGDKIEIN